MILSLDLETAEAQYAAEPPDSLTPEALYEQQWARGVLGRAQNALRAELLKAGRERLFEQVKSLLAGEKAEGGQAEIARGLGVTEGALRVIVHRLRRRYRELLRTEILATVSDESDVDDEVRYLISVLTPSRRGAAAS